MPHTEKPLGQIPPTIPAEKYSLVCSTMSPPNMAGCWPGLWYTRRQSLWHEKLRNTFQYNTKTNNAPVRKCIFISFRIGSITEFYLFFFFFKKRSKLTFGQRLWYLYSLREWNECQMFHCNIFTLYSKYLQDRISVFYLSLQRHQIIFNRFIEKL